MPRSASAMKYRGVAQSAIQHLLEECRVALDDGFAEFVLVREVVIERSLRDADPLQHQFDAGDLEAALRAQLHPAADQGLAREFAARVRAGAGRPIWFRGRRCTG
jgi:hypothetical protein